LTFVAVTGTNDITFQTVLSTGQTYSINGSVTGFASKTKLIIFLTIAAVNIRTAQTFSGEQILTGLTGEALKRVRDIASKACFITLKTDSDIQRKSRQTFCTDCVRGTH